LLHVRDTVLGLAHRVVVMGTEKGVKGVDLDPEALERVREAVRWVQSQDARGATR
jgi:hypothetical protein